MLSRRTVLPAVIYDTMEFACEVYGGIGGRYSIVNDIVGEAVPMCQHGYWLFLNDALGPDPRLSGLDPDYFVGLEPFGIYADINDEIVAAVNAKKGKRTWQRISWQEYCEEGNIVRGE